MSIYELGELDAVLLRVKEKINEKGLKLLSVATEKNIVSFENRYKIKLPVAYRRFINEIANGMIIKDSEGYEYKLLSLFDIEIDSEKIEKPFLLKNFWVWEAEDEDVFKPESEYHGLFKAVANGNFPIMDMGCARSFNLIVSGNVREKFGILLMLVQAL